MTSLGRSTKTGPGRPVVATWKAVLTARGMSSTRLTRVFHLVHGREMPVMSASWKASVPIAEVAT